MARGHYFAVKYEAAQRGWLASAGIPRYLSFTTLLPRKLSASTLAAVGLVSFRRELAPLIEQL